MNHNVKPGDTITTEGAGLLMAVTDDGIEIASTGEKLSVEEQSDIQIKVKGS